MLRLKANKTALYRLVSGYETLPPMRRTEFVKAHRQPAFYLKWWDRGTPCYAYISASLGKAVLLIAHGPASYTRVLSIDDLRSRGMVEGVP